MTETLTREDEALVETPVETAVAATVGAPVGAAPSRGMRARIHGLDYQWIALAVVLGGTIMTILDATVVNVAIHTLQQAFNVSSYSSIAWVITGYSLAQGAVIPVTGWLTDRFGTKRLYLVTLLLFTASSALCGAAWSLPVLILFRVLQGLGGGMLMPIGMTIILRAFGPARMGRVMSYFGVPMLVAPALGPVLGGWFSQDFSWRLIFYINIPIGVCALLAASRFLRETPTSSGFRLDVIGLLTATPAVVGLMYAMNLSTTDGWGSPVVVGLLTASLFLGIAFVLRQLRASQPLLHVSLFRDPTFSWSIVLGFVVITAMFGTVFLLPVFLQTVHGYGPLDTGLLLLPQACIAAVLMPVAGKLSDRIGPRPVVMTGLAFLAVGGILLATVDATTGVLTIIIAMLLRGVAMAGAMMPGMSAGLARIPRHLTSRASSITNTFQRVGQSIGIALLVTFLAAQAAPAAANASCAPSPEVVSALHAQSSAQLCTTLRDRSAAAAASAGGGGANLSGTRSTGNQAADAFLASYRNDTTSAAFDRTFLFLAVIAALGFIPAWFLRRPDRGADGGSAPGGVPAGADA